ncbi:MAG: RsmB/NOP family class I SAM-dependent RNA methyltransferase [Alphaproteobacteria bacterium]|nr:RsmB/NOP family class I SAM-dependent RNA methyltransferase [Alphaproteobacteria bacterium]
MVTPPQRQAAPDEPLSDGIAARLAAYALLNDIFIQRRNFDEALVRCNQFEKLSSRDRAFVRLLVATVLKRARQMDAVLLHFLHEPLAALKPASLINIFRLGIAQFAFLKTAPHAVVNTTVELAEAAGIAHQKPLVNAIMRRLTREGFPETEDRDAGKLNTPEWLWVQWMEDYGVETALQIAAANFDEAPLDITVKGNPAQWAEKLGASLLATGTLRKTGGGFIPDLPGFVEGEWWIQNAAAALPARLFGDLKGKTVIDLCAAPGGKTAQLAAVGANVIAVDRSPERVKRLKENMERLGFTASPHPNLLPQGEKEHLSSPSPLAGEGRGEGFVETVVADGAVWLPPEPADAVLLDAPCTATGTIRHQPDILHLKEPKDQEKLAALQRRLLLNAVNMLKPGGILIYCTCSMQKAEGEDQVDWILAQGVPLQLSPITPQEIPGIAEILTERGEIRALPCHWKDLGGIDGFFIARFVRNR